MANVLESTEFRLARFFTKDLVGRLDGETFTIENTAVELMPRMSGEKENVLVLSFENCGPRLVASKTTQRDLKLLFGGLEKKDLIGGEITLNAGPHKDVTGTDRDMIFIEGA